MALTGKDVATAEKNGITLTCVHTRLYYGWEKQRAISQPVRKINVRKKWMELAERNGIGNGTFNSRVYSYGWGFEKAATEPVNTKYRRKKND